MSIYRSILLSVSFSFFLSSLVAQTGHRIHGTVTGYDGKEAYLAMLYGGHQYVVDTAAITGGTFTFESAYRLESGAYMVVLPPATSFIVLLDAGQTELRFQADAPAVESTLAFTGSPDNTAYYEYLRFFREKSKVMDQVKKEYDLKGNEQDKVALLAQMQQMKQDIQSYQKEVVRKYPGTMTAAMVRCEIPVDIPTFEGSPDDVNLKKYYYQKQHYFDHIDLKDERLIRAPKNVLVDRVEYFLDYLTVQQPDSIIQSVDMILTASRPADVSYRFLLTHLFNKYRESRKIGMDAIYVHIAEQYIATGKAPWITEEEKYKVMSAVKLMTPTLIGKTAPDFVVQKEDGQDLRLHALSSPYTILFFWSPQCAHCRQSIPTLSAFNEKYAAKGVQIVAVCTKIQEMEGSCWTSPDRTQMQGWMLASDKNGGASSIHALYNLRTTPRIFVLDAQKKILAKDIGVEHLEEVMRRLGV